MHWIEFDEWNIQREQNKSFDYYVNVIIIIIFF